jgi:acetyl-CoA carboxylase biotin carboxyl carrier protein
MADDETTAPERTDLASISEFVAQLSAHMKASGLASLEVEIPEARIRLRSERPRQGGNKGRHSDRRDEPLAMPDETIAASDDETTPETDGDDTYIVSPMIGTFYAAPGPGEPEFVEVGDRVEVGQTIAIIEAMKIMNEIVCDQTGTIAEILVRNADAVEYGQPLFRLIADGS